MSPLSKLLRRFAQDESGVFAVIFGLMAIVLIALGGAVVDYVALEQTRTRAQTALDAAALALQPEIFKAGYNEATIRQRARAIVAERIGDTRVTVQDFTSVTKIADGSLYLRARFTMPTMFVSLVGVNTLGAMVESEATRKKLELEVMMVLDNSGSMDKENRMPRLVDAAKCATYILMYDAVVDAPSNSNTCVAATGAKLVEDVRVGVVPFTMYVNVGIGNASATWIDKTGASAIHNDNFDNDDDEDRLGGWPTTYTFPTRQQLFTATGEAWRGCVEARPHIKTGSLSTEYLDTDDTTPVGTNTLFVPMFSPDTPRGLDTNNYNANNYIDNGPAIVSSSYLDYVEQANAASDSPLMCDRPAQGSTRCDIVEERTRQRSSSAWRDPYLKSGTVSSSSPVNFVSSALYSNAFYGRLPPSCACRSPTYTTNFSGSGNTQTRSGYCNSFVPMGLSPRELQERVCKYQQRIGTQSFGTGPNSNCTRTPILPLTADPGAVITTIGNMVAEGGTNIHEGTAWGFRALSPTLPFNQGGNYDEAISKVMIVMTDGENTAYQHGNMNGSSVYSAYGFPYNSQNTSTNSTSGGNITRLGSINSTNAQLVTAMNERTAQTCANAKAAGITVYTIGLATDKVEQSTEAVVKKMLTDCATTPDRARFPTQSSELKAVFEAIANDLSALRLAL